MRSPERVIHFEEVGLDVDLHSILHYVEYILAFDHFHFHSHFHSMSHQNKLLKNGFGHSNHYFPGWLLTLDFVFPLVDLVKLILEIVECRTLT